MPLKYLFYIFITLLPFSFFLPWAMAEKAFFIVFILALFAFGIKGVNLRGGAIRNCLIVFLFFSLLSLAFSKNSVQSLWGKAGGLDSFFFFSALFLVFLFAQAAFKKKEDIKTMLFLFLAVSAVSSLLLFFLTPRSVESLALLASFSLALSLYFSFFEKKKVVFGFLSLFFFFVLLFFDFRIVWLAPSLFSFFIFWKMAREEASRPKLILSFLCFAFLASFLFLPNLFPPRFSLVNNISLDNSWQIFLQSSFHDGKNFFLGSGPATFNYQYSLYKDKNWSQTAVEESASGFLTILICFGFPAFLSLIFAFFFFFKKEFPRFFNNNQGIDDAVLLLVFSIFILLIVFRLNFVLLFLLFALFGFKEGLPEKESRSSFKWLIAIALVFLLLSSGFFKFFFAENLAQQAVKSYNNQDIDSAIVEMDKAAKVFNSPDYYIGLSQLYLLKASDIFNNNWSLEDDVAKQLEEKQNNLKDVVSQAETAAEFASNLDPWNATAWQNLGLVYENTSFLIEDRTDKALEAYSKAEELSPSSFFVYFAKARIYERKGEKEKSLEQYEKAFDINPSYQGLADKIKELKD